MPRRVWEKLKPCAIIPATGSHSLMDRIWVCGTQDPGSIPGESTTVLKQIPLT